MAFTQHVVQLPGTKDCYCSFITGIDVELTSDAEASLNYLQTYSNPEHTMIQEESDWVS